MRRLLFVGLILSVLVTGCGGTGTRKAPTYANDGRLKVATSFYPLYEFARAVGGDRVDLVNLVPPGTEPHDWEPTTGHIKTLNAAQLFLYNGAGFEHWVEKTLRSLDNRALRSVETSHGFDLIPAEEVHDGDGEEHAGHDHGDLDPHLWLDPHGALHTVEAIRDAFIAADGANRAVYEANAAAYAAQLKELDQEFSNGLAQCRSRIFFTSHAAFGYLAHRYDLTQHPIMGLAPEAEPTPKALKAVIDEAREHNVKYIFFETLVSDKVAKVVADEVGAQTLVLNPFEGLTEEQIAAGDSYLSIMRANLANLKTALECR